MTTSECDVVAALCQALIQRIGEPRFNLWFRDKTKFTRQDHTLVVGVPNHFYQDWLQKTFAQAVGGAAQEVFAQTLQICFAIDPELFRAARQEEQASPAKAPAVQPRPKRGQENEGSPHPNHERGAAQEGPRAKARPRRWRRLEDFVVGACNRVAHASALSVVEEPEQSGNPLVLHGPVGTGKTHLLEGVYVGLRKGFPEWRVCFVTAEDFTNRFVQAMRLGKLTTFRRQFRDCDALLFDDLQFLATKRATQEEFLHTFDALHAENRPIVLTCDCHPRLAEKFLPELADRLLGGAIWGLAPPDIDTRLQLLRAKALRSGLGILHEDVLRLVAEQLRGNVRELEGALHSLAHYRRVANRPIDLALAREALGELLRHAVRVVQLPEIDRAVCLALQFDAGALRTKERSLNHAHPRMLAVYLARKHTGASYTEVGRYFGGRNHSTAVAAEKRVRQWLQDDAVLTLGERQLRVRDLLERIERDLLR